MNNLEKRQLINEIINNNFDVSYQIEYPALFRYLEEMEEIKNQIDGNEYNRVYLEIDDIDDIDYIPDEYFISKTEERKKEIEEINKELELVESYSTNNKNEINLYDRILFRKINLIKNNKLKELLKIENSELIKRINWRKLPEIDFSLFNSVWLETLHCNREIINNKIKKLEELNEKRKLETKKAEFIFNMKEKIRDYHNYNFQTSKNIEKDFDLINELTDIYLLNNDSTKVYSHLFYKLDERYNLNQNNKKILSKNDLIVDTYQKLLYNNENKIINKFHNIDLNNFYNIYSNVIDNYCWYININLNNYKSDDFYKILSDFELLMMDYNHHLKEKEQKKLEEEQNKTDEDEDNNILKLNIFNYILYKHFNIEKKFIYSTFWNVDIKTNYILSNMPISEISNILEQYKNEIDTKDEMKIYNKLKEYVDYNKKK